MEIRNSDQSLHLREKITTLYRQDEAEVVKQLLAQLTLSKDMRLRIQDRAEALVTQIRVDLHKQTGVEAFMQTYGLANTEGLLLMCLAEALLRIPDAETAQELIQDKLSQANFRQHFKKSRSQFVNLATLALDFTHRLLKNIEKGHEKDWFQKLQDVLTSPGQPLIRWGAYYAMRLLADHFVMGRNMQHALQRAHKDARRGYTHSFDMLGEAALTLKDAERYFAKYHDAIQTLARHQEGADLLKGPSISIKLSALHPRYEFAQHNRVLTELYDRLHALCAAAKHANIALTIDAEEASRLELSLELVEKLANDPQLAGWNGLGLALQAYQKRAVAVIEWLADLAQRTQRRLQVRLVKGAYWDTEIKLTQVNGYTDYPVFTRKSSTDLSYIVCAQKLLANPIAFYPAFATHNALTVSTILEMVAQSGAEFEFQKLHGMGDTLYDHIIGTTIKNHPVSCRVYAPVGEYKELLPYLVRRLLENGANSSFVNQIGNEALSISSLNADPIEKSHKLMATSSMRVRHPAIPLPRDLYGPHRLNSGGVDLSHPHEITPILNVLATPPHGKACSIIAGKECQTTSPRFVTAPFDRSQQIGEVYSAEPTDLQQALNIALTAAETWRKTSADMRANCLMKAADLLEQKRLELIQLCVYEGGKTIPDAVAEVREAVDFCRYYAREGLKNFSLPLTLPGPTGELNTLQLSGRGVFVCISPWNFPLAIFLGQITAALMAGNAVLAKPAGQTPLIATYAVKLLHQAGIPPEVLHLVLASGQMITQHVLTDPRIAGVAFTGSTVTAWSIHRTLAERQAPIIPLIAETGGQNVMIVDSSALIEQVVMDVMTSAFQSAGQRCSALRAVFIQEEICTPFLDTLAGAMAELTIGNPIHLATDIGPVIDQHAETELKTYIHSLHQSGKWVAEAPLDQTVTAQGSFVAPVAFEIENIRQLTTEHFGPILHIIRYQRTYLDNVIEAVNSLGYGLTFGLHTRLDSRIKELSSRIKVGNVYINRNMIGATVGVQPFGGLGLSGTGPKAGGPYYLHRFATEKTISINTTAQGGNASLMTLQEDL